MKSDIDIKTDIFHAIQGSELHKAVTGELRKTGKRPHGSCKEDIVISMLANVNGEIQIATVNVNIYVSAMVVDGQAEERTLRLQQLCHLASELFQLIIGDDFRATLQQQRVLEISGADEYVINNKIEYKNTNF